MSFSTVACCYRSFFWTSATVPDKEAAQTVSRGALVCCRLGVLILSRWGWTWRVGQSVRIMMRLIPPVDTTLFNASAIGQLYCCWWCVCGQGAEMEWREDSYGFTVDVSVWRRVVTDWIMLFSSWNNQHVEESCLFPLALDLVVFFLMLFCRWLWGK